MFLTKKFAIAFFLFALVVALYHLSLLSTLDKATRAILNPLQAQAISLAQNTNTELSIALSSKRALLTQVRRLEKKALELTSEILALQKIKQENEELRAILKFGTETRFTILPSRIIHITNKDGEQAILLDNGAKDGIVKGNAVVVLNGTIIGKVIEVSDEVARVRLTTDNKKTILATVGDGANFVAGVASGRSEEHTSELQSQSNLVCRLLLEKKNSLAFSIDSRGTIHKSADNLSPLLSF